MTGMPEAIWLCRREKSPDAAPSSTPRLRSCPLAQRQRSVFGGSLADLFGLAGFQLLEPQLELLRRKILRGYAPRLLGTRERFEVHHTDCRMLLFTNDLTERADQAAGRKPCNCWC